MVMLVKAHPKNTIVHDRILWILSIFSAIEITKSIGINSKAVIDFVGMASANTRMKPTMTIDRVAIRS